MNTTFNLSRFFKVLSNEWRLNLKKMLLFWGCMLILAVIYFAFFWGNKNLIPRNQTFGLSFFLLCILQGFYLQFYFHEFSSKTKTQALLLLPASRSETFWAKFLPGVILYVLLFSAYLFIVLKWNGMHNNWIMEIKGFPADDWRTVNFQNYQTLPYDLMAKLMSILVWLFSVAAYLFGTLLFKKLAAFKSLAFWFTVIMGLVLITCIIVTLFFGVWPSFVIPGIVIAFNNKGAVDGDCGLSSLYPNLLYGLGLFICLALLFISRIKYNEKTI